MTMRKTVPVSIAQARKDDAGVVCDASLASRLGVPCGQSVTLSFGKLTAKTRVCVSRSKPGSRHPFFLEGALLETLCLTPRTRVRVAYDRNRYQLRLGPVVGVFAMRGPRENRFIGQGSYFRELIRLGRREGMVVFTFAPKDIDWQNQVIRGLTYSEKDRRWRRRLFPFPDVVYDRMQTRRFENQKSVQQARIRLQNRRDIAWFNNGFLDKWRAHRLLSQEPRIQGLLPDTRPLTNSKDLQRMLEKHRLIWVKPTSGSLGRGLWVVGRRQRQILGYWYRHYGAQKVTGRRRMRSLKPVWRKLQRKSDRQCYIVQQDISLAQYQRRRFDIRILLQKDGEGRWCVSRVYARLGKRGSLRTNLTTGARLMRIRLVLEGCFGRSRARLIHTRVIAAGRAVADALDQRVDEQLGELGLDFGLDRSGRPWLIEVNTKPVRMSVSKHPISVKRPLHYACRLANLP